MYLTSEGTNRRINGRLTLDYMGINVEKTTLMSVNRPLIDSLIGEFNKHRKKRKKRKRYLGFFGFFVVEKENVAGAPN